MMEMDEKVPQRESPYLGATRGDGGKLRNFLALDVVMRTRASPLLDRRLGSLGGYRNYEMGSARCGGGGINYSSWWDMAGGRVLVTDQGSRQVHSSEESNAAPTPHRKGH